MANKNEHSLRKATEARKAKVDAGTLIRLTPLEKAKANPTSLRAAINGKCWQCVHADTETRPRHKIRDCIHSDCTLHAVRPYQQISDRLDKGTKHRTKKNS